MNQLPDEAAVVCLIHVTSERLKKLKAELRSQACPPFRVYREIEAQKRTATALCSIQAQRHGRLHPTRWTHGLDASEAMQVQAEWVEKMIPEVMAGSLPQAA